MMRVKCPACGKDVESVLVEQVNGYSIYQCADCRLHHSIPPVMVQGFYDETPCYDYQKEAAGYELAWYHRRFLKMPTRKGGRLLDCGCGTGHFLKQVSDRYTVAGLDFNESLVKIARERHGLADVHAKSLDDFSRQCSTNFDVITCFEVLEHQPDPNPFIESLRKLAGDDAELHFSVPNGPLSRHLLSRENDTPPHHFLRWNAKAIRTFFERHGFRVVRIERFGGLNWHFTVGQILTKLLPKAREVYRSNRAKGGCVYGFLKFLRYSVIRVFSVITLPAAMLLLRRGFIGLYVVVKPAGQGGGAASASRAGLHILIA
jgi:2-polyprenyl-3-methyl-5-hydroxy-6-metoxy-1,4-benzoquinol methylase